VIELGFRHPTKEEKKKEYCKPWPIFQGVTMGYGGSVKTC